MGGRGWVEGRGVGSDSKSDLRVVPCCDIDDQAPGYM